MLTSWFGLIGTRHSKSTGNVISPLVWGWLMSCRMAVNILLLSAEFALGAEIEMQGFVFSSLKLSPISLK